LRAAFFFALATETGDTGASTALRGVRLRDRGDDFFFMMENPPSPAHCEQGRRV
jgi:hypothetical protein